MTPIKGDISMGTPRTLLVMAGGTGGHIFPALAVAEYLRDAGWRVVWLGNKNGMEGQLVPKYHFQFEHVQFGGVRGKGLSTLLRLPINLSRALKDSAAVLNRIKPDVVLGMGGYITFPAGSMAALKGIPLVLHEQNSLAGLSNRLLAKIATARLCAFPNALPNSQWTGNPLRSGVCSVAEPKARYAGRTGPLKLLVVGGSLGAAALNTIVPQALALIDPAIRPSVVHQSGQKHLDALKSAYHQAGLIEGPDVTLVPFIDDVASAYAEADIVICRSGAMTVAEIAAIGVPAFFVPFPFAVDDHQMHNARFLSEAGAAWTVAQSKLDVQQLAEHLLGLNREQLLARAEKARALAKPQATAEVAEVCSRLAQAYRRI